MATSGSNSAGTADRILVKGIPSTINSDKLTIYFQRRKFGGGDVQSVTFPVSSRDPDTAIVIFEEAETVVSVLKNIHKLGGKDVTVTAIQSQPKIFERIVARISDFVIQKIKSTNEDIDDVFQGITDSTGCSIDQNGQAYEVKGEWYQMQAAFERLEAAVSDSLEKSTPPSPSPSPSLNGYLSSPASRPAPTPVTAPTPAVNVFAPPPARNVVSTMIDKDIYAYMKKVHQSDLNAIKKRFEVDFECIIIGDAAKIEVTPTASGADPQKGAKALEDLNQTVSDTAAQDVVEIDSKFPSDTFETIYAMLGPEFPHAHMDRVSASPNQIIIIASDDTKCRMAVDMFKHYLGRAEPMQTPQPAQGTGSGSNANVAGGDNKVAVDKDIYEYLKKMNGPTLDRIWDSNGAKANVTTIGDCTTIELSKRSGSTVFRPEEAIDHFQRMYNRANESVCQETYDLRKFQKAPTDQRLADAIRMTKMSSEGVHVAKMVIDPEQVLFIADKKEKCEQAIKMFARIIGGGK